MPKALTADLTLEREGVGRAGVERIRLLRAIKEAGSISGAGRRLGLSFRGAWEAVRCLNGLAGVPVVAASPGGRNGGGAVLTPAGLRFLQTYDQLRDELQDVVARMQAHVADGTRAWTLEDVRWPGRVRRAEGREVEVETLSGALVVAQLRDGDRSPAMEVGAEVVATFSSRAVLLAGLEVGRTSARNLWAATVRTRDETSEGVRVGLALASGDELHALVTPRSADALVPSVGAGVRVLLKASQVHVASRPI